MRAAVPIKSIRSLRSASCASEAESCQFRVLSKVPWNIMAALNTDLLLPSAKTLMQLKRRDLQALTNDKDLGEFPWDPTPPLCRILTPDPWLEQDQGLILFLSLWIRQPLGFTHFNHACADHDSILALPYMQCLLQVTLLKEGSVI